MSKGERLRATPVSEGEGGDIIKRSTLTKVNVSHKFKTKDVNFILFYQDSLERRAKNGSIRI